MHSKAIDALLHALIRTIVDLFLLMRLTTLLIFIGILHATANGYAQEKITLSEKNAPLSKVFRDIQLQTEYNIWFDNKVLEGTTRVSFEIKNAEIGEALAISCKGQPVEFAIFEKSIIIKRKQEKIDVKPERKGIISGKVVNEKNQAVVAATIVIMNTGISFQTDSGGNFQIGDSYSKSVIIISHVGYENQIVQLDGTSKIIIRLSISVSKLDEIEIVGYGTSTKRYNTGSVSKIKNEDISRQPVTNLLQAMEGLAPGLLVTQTSGLPGTSITVELRGRNSIASGNDPLYIIDGVPFSSTSMTSSFLSGGAGVSSNPFSVLNPTDILSIEILKDADATAIYGSRGANGVILITTKKGRTGKTRLDMSAYSGVGNITRRTPLLKTSDYLRMRREAFNNDNVLPTITNAPDLLLWDTTSYTDWQKILIGNTSHIYDLQGSVSGGNSNTQFIFSSGFHDETTIFPSDFADKRYSTHLQVTNASPSQRFKTAISATYNVDDNKLPTTNLGNYANLAPDAPAIYDAEGKLNWENSTWLNPFSYLQQQYKTTNTNLLADLKLSYEIVNGLSVLANAGYTNSLFDEMITLPRSSYKPTSTTQASSYFANNEAYTWIFEPQIDYKIQIKKSELSLLIGASLQHSSQDGKTIAASGFSSDAMIENLGAASNVFIEGTNSSDYHYASMFSRINYKIQDKYILNFTARRDGSSRFGPGKQFADFGAVGGGWIFTKEKFFINNFKNLSYGKLRMSYGSTGNDKIGDYGYLSTYSSNPFTYQGISGLLPTNLANQNYGWEINKKFETAIELGFFKDRILFTGAYFQNKSSNQLVGYSLPSLTGFNSVIANLGAVVKNWGEELEINASIIKQKKWSWTANANFTFTKNKLVAFPGIENSSYATVYVVGQSLFVQRFYKYTGVDPNSGVYTFKDFDHDGIISSPNDKQVIKTIKPDYYGTLQNHFQIGDLQIDFSFQFVHQLGRNYNANNFDLPGSLNQQRLSNQPIQVLGRWQFPGDIVNIQRYNQSYADYSPYSKMTGSDKSISDASFVRMRNISVSYALPRQWIEKLKIENAKIYLQGQNIFTLTGYPGADPENQGVSVAPIRTISAGVQLIF